MFCNKCGKTLNPEAQACPSCGQPVGDSRFEGSGYTSSQARFVPDGPAAQSGYTPYTKTTYFSSPDEGGDVYSRTAYRPVLSEDEGQETTGNLAPEPEPEEAPEDGQQDDAPEEPREGEDAPQSAAPAPKAEPAPLSDEEKDALGIEIRPLQPIRKTGISPEVQRYIEQTNQKSRMKRKAGGQEAARRGKPRIRPPQTRPRTARRRPRRTSAPRGVPPARPVGDAHRGVLAVIVLLVVGVLFIADKTAIRAQIPGVTYTLYTEGISLIKSTPPRVPHRHHKDVSRGLHRRCRAAAAADRE